MKQAVEKLLKAELLQNDQDEETASQAGGDDEDVAMAEKIQAQVVGSETKAQTIGSTTRLKLKIAAAHACR